MGELENINKEIESEKQTTEGLPCGTDVEYPRVKTTVENNNRMPKSDAKKTNDDLLTSGKGIESESINGALPSSNQISGNAQGIVPDSFNLDFTSQSYAASQILRQHEDEHLWRKQYLQKSFYLVTTILYVTFLIVLLVGMGLVDLSDAVLMTMLGTTVAHVVGILAIAFHWLYPQPSSRRNK